MKAWHTVVLILVHIMAVAVCADSVASAIRAHDFGPIFYSQIFFALGNAAFAFVWAIYLFWGESHG